MAREARVAAKAVAYRNAQRGDSRQDIFLLDEDRRRFSFEAPRAKVGEHGLTVLGRCLTTNRIQLVAAPRRPGSLAMGTGQARWRYTMDSNRRYGGGAHLRQGRLDSCPLGPAHSVTAPDYVDWNPVRAGSVGRAAQGPWSSAAARGRGGACVRSR